MATNDAFNDLPRITEEGAQDMGLTVLLKGFSGAGKSSLAVGFPEPICYIHADSNKLVAKAAKAAGRNIDLIALEDWGNYEDIIIPEAKARQIPARTLVVDDASSLAYNLINKMQGSKARPSFEDYAAILRRQFETTMAITNTAIPQGAHPGYNVVFTSRLKDYNDESGALLGYQCCMWGQFKDHIESFFNYVLLCESSTANKIVANKSQLARQFKIYSVPPNRYHTCKGGKLPPEIVVPDGKDAFEILNQYWKVKE